MILSIICEELGVFGAIMVLILFGMLLYRLLFIAQNAPDLYGSLVVSGIFAHIALQVILNVMVVINCIPTTGITSLYQLWRYVGAILNGGNGTGIGSLFKD